MMLFTQMKMNCPTLSSPLPRQDVNASPKLKLTSFCYTLKNLIRINKSFSLFKFWNRSVFLLQMWRLSRRKGNGQSPGVWVQGRPLPQGLSDPPGDGVTSARFRGESLCLSNLHLPLPFSAPVIKRRAFWIRCTFLLRRYPWVARVRHRVSD